MSILTEAAYRPIAEQADASAARFDGPFTAPSTMSLELAFLAALNQNADTDTAWSAATRYAETATARAYVSGGQR